jgi:hypothetical protein
MGGTLAVKTPVNIARTNLKRCRRVEGFLGQNVGSREAPAVRLFGTELLVNHAH